MAGDEDDLAAIRDLMVSLPEDAYGQVFVEVPGDGAREQLPGPDRVGVLWLDRSKRCGRVQGRSALNRGEALAGALVGWAAEWFDCEDDSVAENSLIWLGAENSEAVSSVRETVFVPACGIVWSLGDEAEDGDASDPMGGWPI